MAKRKEDARWGGHPYDEHSTDERKYWLSMTCSKCSAFLSKEDERVWCKRCEKTQARVMMNRFYPEHIKGGPDAEVSR